METCSFSKFAGFAGVRLGWTVVPAALKYADGTPVRQDWNRVMSTCFNGASNVAQAGGLACVSDAGMAAMWELVAYYKVRPTAGGHRTLPLDSRSQATHRSGSSLGPSEDLGCRSESRRASPAPLGSLSPRPS